AAARVPLPDSCCPSRRQSGGLRVSPAAERGRRNMDWICWVVPVKPGKTEVAREYCRALETTRRADYEASERELGIEREVFFLWSSPAGEDHIVLYMDADDMTKALDVWE